MVKGNNPTTVRVSPVNEKELYEYVQSKGSVKKALNSLFRFYQSYQDKDYFVQKVITEIKKEFDFSEFKQYKAVPQNITSPEEVKMDEGEEEFLGAILK